MSGRLFPTVLIALDVCAAGVYDAHSDWRRFI